MESNKVYKEKRTKQYYMFLGIGSKSEMSLSMKYISLFEWHLTVIDSRSIIYRNYKMYLEEREKYKFIFELNFNEIPYEIFIKNIFENITIS